MSATANVLALPAHVSPSQISSWHSCGRQYLLSRVMQLPEEPMGHLIGGSAVHTTIEAALKGKTLTFEEAFHAEADRKGGISAITWRGRATRAYPNGEDPSFWLAEGPKMVERGLAYVDTRITEGYEVQEIEASFSPTIGGRQFIARPDLVMSHPEGTWLITDWKSGQSAGDFAWLQMSVYGIAIAENRGIDIKQVVGEVVLVRKGTVTRYSPSNYAQLSAQMVTDFTAGTQAGVFVMGISNRCVACPVRAHCDYGKTLGNQGGDE